MEWKNKFCSTDGCYTPIDRIHSLKSLLCIGQNQSQVLQPDLNNMFLKDSENLEQIQENEVDREWVGAGD